MTILWSKIARIPPGLGSSLDISNFAKISKNFSQKRIFFYSFELFRSSDFNLLLNSIFSPTIWFHMSWSETLGYKNRLSLNSIIWRWVKRYVLLKYENGFTNFSDFLANVGHILYNFGNYTQIYKFFTILEIIHKFMCKVIKIYVRTYNKHRTL